MPERPETLFDRVTARAQELNRGVVNALLEMVPQLPGKVKLNEREQLARYRQLTAPDVASLVTKHGEAAVNRYIYEMERLRQRYGG